MQSFEFKKYQCMRLVIINFFNCYALKLPIYLIPIFIVFISHLGTKLYPPPLPLNVNITNYYVLLHTLPPTSLFGIITCVCYLNWIIPSHQHIHKI